MVCGSVVNEIVGTIDDVIVTGDEAPDEVTLWQAAECFRGGSMTDIGAIGHVNGNVSGWVVEIVGGSNVFQGTYSMLQVVGPLAMNDNGNADPRIGEAP